MESVSRCFKSVFLVGFVCSSAIGANNCQDEKQDQIIFAPSDWPEGCYGLPMAKTGCPIEASFNWETGWVYEDTENDNPNSSSSVSFHIEGQVEDSSVNRSFCIKTSIAADYYRPMWPSGTYCIYQKKEECPTGFHSGWVSWQDEMDDFNKNYQKGTLPMGNFRVWYTRIFFCCRSDGPKSTPIDLPTASPFYLFAHLSEDCQQVRRAVSSSEWIYYDTEDYNNEYDHITSPAPYIVNKGRGIGQKIYFCYYTNTSTVSLPTSSIPPPATTTETKTVTTTATTIATVTTTAIITATERVTTTATTIATVATTATITATETVTTVAAVTTTIAATTVKTTVLAATTCIAAATAVAATKTATPTTRAATAAEKQKKPEIEPTSHTSELQGIPTSEPPNSQGNSSKTYDLFKKSCVPQSQTSLTAIAIVIPLICIIAVIVMAAHLFYRLRNLRRKSRNAAMRFLSETVDSHSYIHGDSELELEVPTFNSQYEDSKEDILDEIQHDNQTTGSPLHQSTNTDDENASTS